MLTKFETKSHRVKGENPHSRDGWLRGHNINNDCVFFLRSCLSRDTPLDSHQSPQWGHSTVGLSHVYTHWSLRWAWWYACDECYSCAHECNVLWGEVDSEFRRTYMNTNKILWFYHNYEVTINNTLFVCNTAKLMGAPPPPYLCWVWPS